MKHLTDQSDLNSAEGYDAIFKQRKQKGVDSQDMRRWKLLLRHYKGGRLLDMGCLDSLVPSMAQNRDRNAWIFAIDQSREAIEEMKKRDGRIVYEVGDVYKTRFEDESFDYIVAGELIEHLENPRLFFNEAFRLLKKGGVLAVSTPLNEAVEPGAVDAHRHLWSFTEEDMYDFLFKDYDIELVRLGSEWSLFPPFYKYHFPTLITFARKL